MVSPSLLSTNSLLPGTLIFTNASLMFSLVQPKESATAMAANELYTLNLPGIETFILSFLSPNFALKSTYWLVTVISFAKKSQWLSIPKVVN